MFPFAGAGPYAVRFFDSCSSTETADPSVCTDTIDYTNLADQTRRLPYEIVAPIALPPDASRRPVIIFQHGGGPNSSGQRTNAYGNLVRFLAS